MLGTNVDTHMASQEAVQDQKNKIVAFFVFLSQKVKHEEKGEKTHEFETHGHDPSVADARRHKRPARLPIANAWPKADPTLAGFAQTNPLNTPEAPRTYVAAIDLPRRLIPLTVI